MMQSSALAQNDTDGANLIPAIDNDVIPRSRSRSRSRSSTLTAAAASTLQLLPPPLSPFEERDDYYEEDDDNDAWDEDDQYEEGELGGKRKRYIQPAAEGQKEEEEEEEERSRAAARDRAGESCYWDAASMAPLNALSAAAVARLRAFKPPSFPLWDRLPVSRRAAVLLILFANRRGDLRVVVTMRSSKLRDFAGQAAFPGGMADGLDETPYQIARREAWEEISLPMDDRKLARPFRVEHLCDLPYSLARNEVVVRPCVVMLHVDHPPAPPADAAKDEGSDHEQPSTPSVETSLIPRLDAREVAAVFTAPFHNFLRAEDEGAVAAATVVDRTAGQVDGGGGGESAAQTQDSSLGRDGWKPLPEGQWYEGVWTQWHQRQWRMHSFYVPVHNQRVRRPRPEATPSLLDQDADAGGAPEEQQQKEEGRSMMEEKEEEKEETGRFRVWGMTARILVDAARIAYGEEPEFEHNSLFGEEETIEELEKLGRLKEKPGWVMKEGGNGKKASDKSKI